MNQKINLVYSHTFNNGVIWKILPDEQSNILVMEVRNKNLIHNSHYILDFDKKHFFNIDFPNLDWWTTLDGVYHNILKFKTYRDDKNPSDIQITWYDYINRTIDTDLLGDFKNKNWHKVQNEISFYDNNSSSFDLVKKFIHKILNVEISMVGVEYLEIEKYVIISYYLGNENSLTNYLAVVDLDKNVLLNEKLDQNLKGVGLNTFYYGMKKLICIKQSNQLDVYQL